MHRPRLNSAIFVVFVSFVVKQVPFRPLAALEPMDE